MKFKKLFTEIIEFVELWKATKKMVGNTTLKDFFTFLVTYYRWYRRG